MIDDLNHMRETLAKPQPTTGDLRRLSNLLRRLFIDYGGDLQKISPPRLNRRLHLLAPDVKSLVKANDKDTSYFASIGGSGLFGQNVETFEITGGSKSPFPKRPEAYVLYRRKGKQGEVISLHVDGFLSQPVLFFANEWIKRANVIKYVANVAGGVHSGDDKESSDKALSRIRQIGSLRLKDGDIIWHLNHNTIFTGAKSIDIERDGIDFVLMQMMSAANFLTISPDIIELEEIIRNEIV